MGWMNTGANVWSASSNSKTAAYTQQSAQSLSQLASAERHRELRERGLITTASTPAQVYAVELHLAAQMRGRMELEGTLVRPSPYQKATLWACIAGGLSLLYIFGSAQEGKPGQAVGGVCVLAIILVGCIIAAYRAREREERRAKVVARAVWRNGACGWCGAARAHTLEGEPAPPRVYHALEIERDITG